MGDWPAALADSLTAEEMDPDDATTLNALAWLWATCPADELRDGTRAVEAALRACELTGHAVAGFLDTLAAAYAEAGQFESAVRWQEKTIEMVPPDQRGEYEQRLELYRAGQPFRDLQPAA
jgi:tetratricopeptide (TPR) repeat protein